MAAVEKPTPQPLPEPARDLPPLPRETAARRRALSTRRW
jgi:hypothetical protein